MSDAAARGRFLGELLRRHEGQVRFDAWMREALYHPEYGYYSSGVKTLGRGGDFSTWPTLDGALAAGVAGWIKKQRGLFGGPGLIEIGAGTGELAKQVLRRFPPWQRLGIVEVSKGLKRAQQQLLGWRARWFPSVQDALQESGGRAILYANELVDAFPCRVFRRTAGCWQELHVSLAQGRAIEHWLAADQLPDSTAWEHPWPEGQRIEVFESFRQWLTGWAPQWREGRMLLIDYGDECPSLYARRPMGTLRAYARHQRLCLPEALEGFGRRDLTADINFSDLARWCGTLGLEVCAVSRLDGFLREYAGATGPLQEAAGCFGVIEVKPVRGSTDRLAR